MTTHWACPLTPDTAPLYAQLEALNWRAELDRDKQLQIRRERARLTGELWRLARNGNRSVEYSNGTEIEHS